MKLNLFCKQIQAPRLRLLLSKRIAELAGVSHDEIQTLIRMPSIQR
jgi:DNA primase